MYLIRCINDLNQIVNNGGCALTIGNFDGVHRGHKALLKELKKEGRNRNLPVIVMIFEPQPSELFDSIKIPARLTSLHEKMYYLSQCEIDYVLCINFNNYFANLTARQFIKKILVKYLNVKFLIIGEDFHFGTGRHGNFTLLKEAGRKYNFEVISFDTLFEEDERISSTAIRRALAENKLKVAENLLGRSFAISGYVIHGDKIGRTIGFPTANLAMRRLVSPVKGVYVVEVAGLSENLIPGLANIGTRPTVSGKYQQLEVHLLDVEMCLYGHYINVLFRKKIRDERLFSSLDALKEQIKRDELKARNFFKFSRNYI